MTPGRRVSNLVADVCPSICSYSPSSLRSLLCPSPLPRAGCEEAQVTFVFMPLGADFAERALVLSGALLPAEAQVAAWWQQVRQVRMAPAQAGAEHKSASGVQEEALR